MNAKRVLAMCLCAGFAAPAMAQSFEITHNVVDDFVEGGTVLCSGTGDPAGSVPQYTTSNSLWRAFDLGEFGLGDITVREVQFGIQRFNAPTFGGETEVTINLYQGVAGERPVTGLPLVGTASASYIDQQLTIVSMEIEGCVDAGSSLVVEIVTPDYSESTVGDAAWIGSNGFGETAPSYLSAEACGILQPTTYPEIGCAPCLNPIAIIMTVRGEEGHACEPGGCYADCDGSGSLDFFDFLCFQNAFTAGEPYADCDGSGSLDFFDFLCFQNEFSAGCP